MRARTAFFLPEAMTSGMPARTTIRAACNLDAMPPTAVALWVPRAIFSTVASRFSTRLTVRGLAWPKFSISPSTVVRMIERVGRQQAGGQRGESVVVAEFQFGEGNGVVFVDDGDDAAAEQCDQGVAGVEMALVMCQVVVCQQDLGHAKTGLGKEPFVQGHQAGLADGGAGLQLGNIGGPFLVAQSAHARPHRAGTDNDDLFALGAHGGDLGGQLADLLQIGLLAAVGQDAGAQFDHDAAGIF